MHADALHPWRCRRIARQQVSLVGQPRTLAEADDMAMVRVLARASAAPAVVPTVVVRDELRDGTLEEYCHCRLPGLWENFFAINLKRQYEHPLIGELFARSDSELLAR